MAPSEAPRIAGKASSPAATGASPRNSPIRIIWPRSAPAGASAGTATSIVCSKVAPVEVSSSRPWLSPSTQG